MKLLVLKYSVDATQVYTNDYKTVLEQIQERWLAEPRRKWLHDNRVAMRAERVTDVSRYAMLHGISIVLDGPLLTEYLLRFGDEPCVFS